MTDHEGTGGPAPVQDDRIISVAFRWSLAVILGSALLALSVVVLVRGGGGSEVIREKELAPPVALGEPEESVPPMPFRDIAMEAGVDFVHGNGAAGERLLPETMGSGVAWIDFDNDGDQDLLLVDGSDWPWTRSRSGHDGTPTLLANDGSGRFRDVTVEAGLARMAPGKRFPQGMGAAVGDVDGDGWVDLYLTSVGANRLLRNRGGVFEDISERSGAAGSRTVWSTSAGFADLDGDDDLDLVVCSYITWSREIDFEVGFTLNGRDRAYGPPTSFRGAFPELFRNEGGGRFTEVGAAAGLHTVNPSTGEPVAKSLGLAIVDVDDDGLLDLFFANDTVQNLLYRNQGGLQFEEVGTPAGVGFDSAGRATGAMGVDSGDIRNDGSLGLVIGNFANEMSSLYVQQGSRWLFADSAIIEGVGSPSRLRLSFGVLYLDADLDGRLDLLQVNGHLEPEISEVQASQTYEQPAQLFWNRGPESPSCFALAGDDLVGDLASPSVGRSAAYADMDGDGDLDVAMTQNGSRARLLRNDQQLGNHWLRVELEGTGANRDAIGARLVLHANGVVQRRMVMPTRGYLSQVELPITFGLGAADRVDRLEIFWPDRAHQVMEGLEVDRAYLVRHPSLDAPPR